MKIRYWDHNNRQNSPQEWTRSKLIKPKTLMPDDYTFRKILETVSNYPQHEFLVPVRKVYLLYDIPANVIPVLQVVNNYDLQMQVDRFANYCESEGKPVVVSFFTQTLFHLHNFKADWVMISGNEYDLVKACLTGVMRKRIPTYVEYFKGSRNMAAFPKELQRRMILLSIIKSVISRDFIQLRGQAPC